MAHQAYGRAGPAKGRLAPGEGTIDTRLDASSFPFRSASGARTPPLDSPPIPRACRFLSDAGRVFSPAGLERARRPGHEPVEAGPRRSPTGRIVGAGWEWHGLLSMAGI